MYIYKTTLKLHQTDAAGVLFFSKLMEIAYDAYHEFMEHIQFGLGKIIREESFLLPIIHTEADYNKPLFVGDHLTVKFEIERVGTSSFVTRSTILKDDVEAGMVRIVQVAIDKKTGLKIDLPPRLKKALS